MTSIKLLPLIASFGLVLAVQVAAAQTTPVKPADVKPADAKPADAKPADTKSAETKPTSSDAKPATDTKADTKPKFTKAQIEAFLSKCSDEADAKGLSVKKGKAAERKEFRRACMHKFGVDPK